MIVGCVKEVKQNEHRVGLIPACAKTLIMHGHKVLIEKNAGISCGITNEDYLLVGAQIIESASEIWEQSDMIVKVKEPIKSEYPLMQQKQILFTFLHLAAELELTNQLLNRKITAIAFETIQKGNSLPILKPMSEVAGRMAIQIGAWCLEKQQGGLGILLGGVPGVPCGKIAILGGGVVGTNAAKMGIGIGAHVTILDNNLERLAYLDDIFCGRAQTLYSTAHNIEEAVLKADLVVGGVLIAGAKAPKLVNSQIVSSMRKGSVIVDVAIDQGGCIETIKPTTHDKPTYLVNGVVHYGVTNMPGAVACTSTFALAHTTIPYTIKLADLGVKEAIKIDSGLALGINTFQGHITNKAVAEAHGKEYIPFEQL
jgi:alanine dehydrogenase